MANENQQVGQIVQIIGPVVDVEFEGGYLPPIYQALRITSEGFDVETPIDVIVEGRTASRRRSGACGFDASDGRYGPRDEGN